MKVVSKNKRDWHERLPEALWAYGTTHRTATQSTPYSLVFGGEAVLPLEVQIPSLRVAMQCSMTMEQNAKLRLAELEGLDSKRLQAQQTLEVYQARMSHAFDKKVRRPSFKKRDLVLAIKRPIVISRRSKGKFEPKWEGPVEWVFSNCAYQLITADGRRMPAINGRFLKWVLPLKRHAHVGGV